MNNILDSIVFELAYEMAYLQRILDNKDQSHLSKAFAQNAMERMHNIVTEVDNQMRKDGVDYSLDKAILNHQADINKRRMQK